MSLRRTFPFTAILGNEDLRLGLLLNAIDPRIGGLLVRGDKGTAKSTAARGLAELLPPVAARAGCPLSCDPCEACAFCDGAGATITRARRVVELPLGASEDRLVGSLDLERALRAGERRFEPGILAAADRGVLYVDEVNLLPDHLVDLLLDVAASGVNVVERDGQSLAHPARFVLVGTMNPEEGELRPQLLDRFGLVAEAKAPADPAVRATIVRQRIAFDRDPDAFRARFSAEQRALADRVAAASERVATVQLAGAQLALAIDLALEARVDGVRPDITIARSAAALAALEGRDTVVDEDVYRVALLVLPHRQRRRPFDDPGEGPSLEDLVGRHRAEREGSTEGREGAAPQPDRRVAPEEQLAVRLPEPSLRSRMRAADEVGRHGPAALEAGGRVVRERRWTGRSRELDPLATLRAAAVRGARRVGPTDLRERVRARPSGRLVLLSVDASGSMGARSRMARTKAALLGLLERVYQRRDRVAVQVFRDERVELVVPPTRDVRRVADRVRDLATGGRTPLADALRHAARLLQDERRGSSSALLVVVTDGRSAGDEASLGRSAALAARAADDRLVIDTEPGPIRLGRARALAALLGARFASLDELGDVAQPFAQGSVR